MWGLPKGEGVIVGLRLLGYKAYPQLFLYKVQWGKESGGTVCCHRSSPSHDAFSFTYFHSYTSPRAMCRSAVLWRRLVSRISETTPLSIIYPGFVYHEGDVKLYAAAIGCCLSSSVCQKLINGLLSVIREVFLWYFVSSVFLAWENSRHFAALHNHWFPRE